MGMRERQVAPARRAAAGRAGDPRGGIRSAAVQIVATATLGAIFGFGGLGRYLVEGIAQRDDGDDRSAGSSLVAVLAWRRRPSSRSSSDGSRRRGSRAWRVVAIAPQPVADRCASAADVDRNPIRIPDTALVTYPCYGRPTARPSAWASDKEERPMRLSRMLALGASVLVLLQRVLDGWGRQANDQDRIGRLR